MKKREKGIFVAVARLNQEFETILATVRGFFNWANIEFSGTLLYAHGKSYGKIKEDHETLEKAFLIGAELVKR